jgi:hypothetical protein
MNQVGILVSLSLFERGNTTVVGALDLSYVAMEFPTEPGLTLLVYTAEPGTPTAGVLTLLRRKVPDRPGSSGFRRRSSATVGRG